MIFFVQYPGVPITSYVIMKRDVTKPMWLDAGRLDELGGRRGGRGDGEEGGTARRCWTTRGMRAGSDWLFRVAAENDLGRSDWSTCDRVKFIRGLFELSSSILCRFTYRKNMIEIVSPIDRWRVIL